MKVTRIENRGSKDVPYGFVYFDDDTRIGFSNNEGVWPANWGGNTPQHLRLAKAALDKAEISLKVKEPIR